MKFNVKLLAMMYTYVIFQGSSSRYTHTNICYICIYKHKHTHVYFYRHILNCISETNSLDDCGSYTNISVRLLSL